jgi:hypothetical protein
VIPRYGPGSKAPLQASDARVFAQAIAESNKSSQHDEQGMGQHSVESRRDIGMDDVARACFPNYAVLPLLWQVGAVPIDAAVVVEVEEVAQPFPSCAAVLYHS